MGRERRADDLASAHIADRYAAFTIIVLGESILSTMLAVAASVDGGTSAGTVAPTVLGGVSIVCAMWWLYFSEPSGQFVSRARGNFEAGSSRAAYFWGYGHYVIYMAAAAAGAGIAAVVDAVSHDSQISLRTSTLALAVPVAVYVICMMALHRHASDTARQWIAYLVCAVAVVASGALGLPILGIGVLLALLVAFVASGLGQGSDSD